MTALLLWALATLDAAFIGYREAAGRNALIDKGDYYRRAMLRGALFGQLAVGVVGLVAAILLLLTPQPATLIDELRGVGARMLTVYVPYALILLVAFVLRIAPSVDLRSITSVVIFGPFTLIRPVVVIAGVAWGFSVAPGLATSLLCLLILFLMLGLESILRKLRKRGVIS